MSLDLVTLALAKKYTDEKIGGGGGSHGEYATTEYVDTAISNIPQPDFDAREGEAGHVLNRPGYREVNKDLYAEVNTVNKGNYCLVDFNVTLGDYKNFLKYDDLVRDYNRKYDYYIYFEMISTSVMKLTQKVRQRIKKLDEENCYFTLNTNQLYLTSFYIVHNRELLSDELKEKIPNNGIWLIVDGEQAYTRLKNFKFWEYMYTKFDEYLIPDNVMFKRDMSEYATTGYVDDAIGNIDISASLLVTVDVSTMTADYSRTEIINAAKSGKLVYADVMNQLFVLKNIANASFTSVTYMAGTKIDLTSFYIDDDKKVHINVTDIYNVLPSYSSSDYGKYATPSANGLVYKELPSVDLTGYATQNYVNDAIANIDIPDNISTDAVQYVEQSLTEEQQMQARANLGLYGKAKEYTLLRQEGPDTSGHVWEITKHKSISDQYHLEIVDANTEEVVFKATLQTKGHNDNTLSGGTDMAYYWGNPSLIKNDPEAANIFSMYTDIDTGEPIVMYRALHEDYGWDFLRLYISSELQPSYWIGFYVNIKEGSPEIVIKKIPEEYLPNSAYGNLSYNEQELAEDQQMQARKNLGLYYQDWERQTDKVYELFYYDSNSQDKMIDEIERIETYQRFTVYFDGEGKEYQGTSYYPYQFIGNPNLIPNFSLNDIFFDTADYSASFVIYKEVGMEDFTLVVDSNISSSGQFFVEVYRIGEEIFVTKKIPEEYLPDSIPKDNSLGITGATVGQIVQIKEVDESGIPVAWEPVNNSGWKKLIDYTTPEQTWTPDIPQIIFTDDDDGNPLNATRIYIKITGVITGGVAGRLTINNSNFWDWKISKADEKFCISMFCEFSDGVCVLYSSEPNSNIYMTWRYLTVGKTSIESIIVFGGNYNTIHLEPGAHIEIWGM